MASDAWLSASSIGISAISRAFGAAASSASSSFSKNLSSPTARSSPLFASSTFFCCFLTSFVGFFLKPLAPRRTPCVTDEKARDSTHCCAHRSSSAVTLAASGPPSRRSRAYSAACAAACSSIAMAMGG